MQSYEFSTVNDAYATLAEELLSAPEVPSRTEPTKELSPVNFTILDPTKPFVTASGRVLNPAFQMMEVLWILSGDDSVDMMAPYNSGLADLASDNGVNYNAAYGARLRRTFGHDQLDDIVRTLEDAPESRQAVVNIWDPRRDRGFRPNPDEDYGPAHPSFKQIKHVTKDRACNVTGIASIRDGKLNWMQTMRSNDLIWGTPNNFAQWLHIQKYVAARLGVPVGQYHHVVNSLHVYEKHWDELKTIRFYDLYDELGIEQEPPHQPWTADDVTNDRIAWVASAERAMRSLAKPSILLRGGTQDEVGPAWLESLKLFAAWHYYKRGQDASAVEVLATMEDSVMMLAQLRYFVHWRWHWNDAQWSGIHQLMDDLIFNKEFKHLFDIRAWVAGEL